MSSYDKNLSHLPQYSFDDEENLLEDLIRTPKHISLNECLASLTIADKVCNLNQQEDGFPEQSINQLKTYHYKLPRTTNNIPSAPAMAATINISPTTQNTIADSIPCYEPRTTHTGAPILSFEPLSSYTITPTTQNNNTLPSYHSSSCTVPTTETETNYDPSYIDPLIETYPLASHITPTNPQLYMNAHNAHPLLNSQPPPPSGLPMTPIYLTNQLNKIISAPPAYTSHSLDPVVRQMAMNFPTCLGSDPSTFNLSSFNDTTSAVGGLHYNDVACANFGFFSDTGMTVRQSEAMKPCTLGMYSSAPMQTAYDLGDLQVLRDCDQLMVGCSTSMTPLHVTVNDISTLKKSGFKVHKLISEEKKKKISRYIEERKTSNFSKRIMYDCRKKLADNRHRVRGRFAKKGVSSSGLKATF